MCVDILKIVLYIVFVIDCIALSAIILLQELIRKDVRLTVCEYDVAKILSDEAVRQGRQVHIHIALDTGMSRIG